MTNDEKRKQHNKEILERMKNPDDKLSAFNKNESFFPIRKPIEKDRKAIKELYGDPDHDK